MKHIARLMALLLLLTAMNAACAEEHLASWPWDQSAPNQIVRAGRWWYAATGLYGSPTASLAIGPSPEELTTVYASDGYIWGRLHATETHAAWVEEKDGVLSWMVHERESGKTTVVHTEELDDRRPCFSIALNGALYYVRVRNSRSELVRLRLTDDTSLFTSREAVLPTPEDAIITSLSLNDYSELTIACEMPEGCQLIRLNILGEEVARDELPEEVMMVFYAEYAPSDRVYVLYYAAEDAAEMIGFCQQRRLSPVMRLASHTYAYHDYVTLAEDHLICTLKIERTGAVADNFITLDVNLVTREAEEHKGVISATVDGDRLLLLTLDPDHDRLLLERAW